MSAETVGCYRWKWDGHDDRYWSTYPGLTEEYDNMETTTLFWRVGSDER